MEKVDKRSVITELLNKGVERIYPSKEEFEKVLLGDKKIKIYLGVDPTGEHLHIGHAASLLFLSKLQEMGHKIIFLIGDFTARIGDPSDKKATRRQLSEKEVKKNLKNFKAQASKVINFKGENPAKLKLNSKWLSKMTFEDVVNLSANFTVQQMIQRDMFQERLRESKPIGVHEFLYPLMQGYDSVAMDVDAEIGGNDQTFNMLAGRDLMRILKNKNKFVVAMKLLVNSEGKKMSKTEGDLINLSDAPNDMFGKVMAMKDSFMFQLAEISTRMTLAEIDGLKKLVTQDGMNPRDAKARIAHELVKIYYDEKLASSAQTEFDKVFKSKELPDQIPVMRVKGPIGIVDLILQVKLAGSRSDVRRLIEQGGVRVNQEKVTRDSLILNIDKKGILLQVGKRRFVRVTS